MRLVMYISIGCLLLITYSLKAQTTLHADPRLAVLVKKPHSVEQVTASAIVKHKKLPKITPQPDAVTNMPSTTSAPVANG